MPDDLIYQDVLVWSEQQADLLRRLARGERVNDAIDWENVVEEIESLGRSELHSVQSLLVRAITHMLKSPSGRTVPPGIGATRRSRSSATRVSIGRRRWPGASTSTTCIEALASGFA